MNEILLPIGQPLGRTAQPEGEPMPATAAVRVAAEFHDLSPEQYRLWLTSFNHSDRGALEQAAQAIGTADAATTIGELTTLGVLVTFDPAEDLTAFLSSYCVIPAGFGLGASTEKVGYFEIGGPDLQPRVRVEFDIFLVWAMAHTRSIWSTCRMLAGEKQLDPVLVARHVAVNLPLLTRSGCAFLDQIAPRS